jgi:predicted nucleic acid-binding Zn finger protein
MKSKARRIVEKWVTQPRQDRLPHYIGEGFVFIYPSRGSSNEHYPVIWVTRKTKKKVFHEFFCGCKGWWFSEEDECYHVKDLKQKIQEGRANIA